MLKIVFKYDTAKCIATKFCVFPFHIYASQTGFQSFFVIWMDNVSGSHSAAILHLAKHTANFVLYTGRTPIRMSMVVMKG